MSFICDLWNENQKKWFHENIGQMWPRLGFANDWTKIGPRLDWDWTEIRPRLDQNWTKIGPCIIYYQDWTLIGLSWIRNDWNNIGPRLRLDQKIPKLCHGELNEYVWFFSYLIKVLVTDCANLVRSIVANISQILHLPVVIFANAFHLHSTILTNPITLQKKLTN